MKFVTPITRKVVVQLLRHLRLYLQRKKEVTRRAGTRLRVKVSVCQISLAASSTLSCTIWSFTSSTRGTRIGAPR